LALLIRARMSAFSTRGDHRSDRWRCTARAIGLDTARCHVMLRDAMAPARPNDIVWIKNNR
jgi:hypothetical protein